MLKSRKHWYWRTLLVIMILLVITAGALIARRVQSARELEQVVEALGGEVGYTENSYIPRWLDVCLSERLSMSLHVLESRLWKPAWLNFSAKRTSPDPLTDEKWLDIHEVLLPYRNQLVYLSFAGSDVGNDTVATLPEYPELVTIDLRLTKVNDGCLDDIGAMSKLKALWLHEEALTADGQQRLIKLREQRFFQVITRTDRLIK